MSPTLTFAIAGALLVLIVAALLLRPLWRDSQRLVLGIALCIGLGTVALYRIVGTPAALEPQPAVAMPQTLDDAIKELQARDGEEAGRAGRLALARAGARQQPAFRRIARCAWRMRRSSRRAIRTS